MKHTITYIIVYIIGCLLWLPIMGILTTDFRLVLGGSVYGWVLFFSADTNKYTKRFWRIWHRVNFRIINSIKAQH